MEMDAILAAMLAEVKEYAGDDKKEPKDAFLTIKDIAGPDNDGDLKGAHMVLGYFLSATTSANDGLRTTGTGGFGNLYVLIRAGKAYPTLVSKMVGKSKTCLAEVKLHFRVNSMPAGTITLTGDGSSTSVWPIRCDLVKARNKNHHPLLFIGFSYDTIAFDIDQSKFSYTHSAN